jgi:hypothetical protein
MAGITERIQKTTDLSFWKGHIPLEFVYTYGRAGERFFRAIMEEGKFLGTSCNKCNKVFVPPRIYCEECLSRIEDRYIEVGNKGTVHTFTVCHESLEGGRYESPKIIAMVNLEGSNGGLVHYIGEVSPESVYIEMRVEAVFKSKRERKGDIFDIKYFRPVKESQ